MMAWIFCSLVWRSNEVRLEIKALFSRLSGAFWKYQLFKIYLISYLDFPTVLFVSTEITSDSF